MSQTEVQHRQSALWSFVSPIVAVIVAVPLSVALASNIAEQRTQAQPAYAPVAAVSQPPVTATPAASCAPTPTAENHVQPPVHTAMQDDWMGRTPDMGAGHDAPQNQPEKQLQTVSNAYNSYYTNTYDQSSTTIKDSFNNAHDSFNAVSYTNKDSFNTVNSNNKDDSQTYISADNGSTVVAPSNTSSNVVVGDDNHQSSSLNNVNYSTNSQESTKVEGSFNSKQEKTVHEVVMQKDHPDNEWGHKPEHESEHQQ